MRFDARRSPSLPDDVAARLMKLAGSRLTQDGVIVIFAQRFSSQPRNREDARERLAALLAESAGAAETAPPDAADARLEDATIGIEGAAGRREEPAAGAGRTAD